MEEWLLFHPSPWPQEEWEPQGLNAIDLFFDAADGTRLHGWYCPVENPRAVVLFAHGNAGHLGHRSWLLRLLQEELRVSVMVFDYRGYGRSEGVPTVTGILQDGRAARTKLAQEARIPEEEIVLFGRSPGGAVMVQLAAESPPRGLVLESTFASLREVADYLAPGFAWIVPQEKLDSRTAIAAYPGPLLQSHGEADSTIPFASGRRLFDSAPGPKEFLAIPGADHNDGQGPAYYERLMAFLDGLPPSP